MSMRSSRRFTLLDLLSLIAATAAGLGGVKALAPENEVFTAPYAPIQTPSWLSCGSVVASNWAFYLSPLFAAWSLGLLILWLRRPRPSLRGLASQPGWSASCATAFGIVTGVVMVTIGVYGRYSIQSYFELAAYPIGIAIGAVWTHLATSGRWRSEPSWIDLAGRLMGFVWLMMVPLLWGQYLATA
jgi:hypothetical protein